MTAVRPLSDLATHTTEGTTSVNVQPAYTPGTRVRIVIEGVVRVARPGVLTLASGTRVDAQAQDVQLEVLEPGFQPGDVVHDGAHHLMRVVPPDGQGCWISMDGHQAHDEDTDPTGLRLIARAITPEPPTDASEA